MNRKVLWAVLVIGVALVVGPLALSLPSKASAGERMMGDFQPIMQRSQVNTTAYYYDRVFTPLGKVVPAMSAQNVAKFEAYVAAMKSMKLPPSPQLQAMMKDFDALIGLMKTNEQIFAQVPAGLKHYQPLVRTMQGNVNDYRQVSSLPSFRLFTWFFVVPGALLILLAGIGLYGGELGATFSHHARPTHA